MDKANTQSKIGKGIKTARLESGLTQSEVAKKAKISTNHYARIERGEINPSIETLEAILEVLKIKSSKILPF
jgi:transcriptional regulator with XRE-family HTH domain